MLCAGIVLPHPPLLVPEVASGAAAELGDLRAACSLALQAGLRERPDRVVLLGTVPGAADATGAPTLAPYGLPGPPVGLPLPFTIGSWLLDRAGWTGPRTIVPVSVEARPPECAALGTRLAGEPGRTLLVIMGDGTARRSAAAPGHFDERAEAFDEAVAAALRTGDSAALRALDPALAGDLLAVGRAAWQVLAAALPRPAGARLYFHGAPYGVCYFVACWRPGP